MLVYIPQSLPKSSKTMNNMLQSKVCFPAKLDASCSTEYSLSALKGIISNKPF